jgi:putative chitinase
MAHIEQDKHGLVVNGTDGNRYKMSAQGWEKNPPVLLNEKDHPGNALYKEAYAAVAKLDAQHHRKPDQHTEQLAAELAVAAREQGLKKIDHVVLSDDRSKAIAVEGGLKSHHRHLATVDTAQASNTPLGQSSAHWLQVTPPGPSHTPAANNPHHQNPGPAQHDAPAAPAPGR